MYCERVFDSSLHQEPVQYSSIITVIIKTVNKPDIAFCFLCFCPPYYPLMQISYPDIVIFIVIGKQQLILGLGHMIDAAGIYRI